MANKYTNTRYTSGKQVSAKIGITSHSENITSLEVTGRVGVNTSIAAQELHVEGSTYISENIGIGTTIPTNAVDSENTSVINVGIVTANQYYGSGLGLTGITSATNATNIYGGSPGQLLYQAEVGVTSAFENGSTGFGLFSRGPSQPPQWLPTAPAGAIEGITIYNEGSLVATSGSFSALNFVGLQVNAIGVVTSGQIGVATITVREQGTVGIATNVIGGIASVTSLDVNQPTGISTVGNIEITSLGVGLGATIGSGSNTGLVTYYGSGIQLSGIVTSLLAGENISLDASTGQVTITGLANTANINADSLVVTGITTLGVVTSVESVGVVTAYIQDIQATSANFTGNVSIGGTLTYEDVKNIDSVGFITARSGINVGYDYDGGTGIGVTILPDGNAVYSGIITTNNLNVETKLGIGTTNPLNDLQVGFANSSFTVVSTATTTLVGIGTTNPQYTLDVRGNSNIDGNLTINNNTVPSLAMVIALGGL